MMGYFSDLPQANVESEASPSASPTKGYFSDLPAQPSKLRSVLSAFPKGILKGISAFKEATSPFPLGPLLGRQDELGKELIEHNLPTRPEGAEEFLETAGEIAPWFVGGPGSLGIKATQIGTGALAKKFLKESDAPELVQDIGTAVASLSPQALRGAISKKIVASPAQKQVYDLLKSHGMTDKQIVPFIQSPKKSKILGKWTKGMVGRENISKESKGVSDHIFGTIKQKGEQLAPLTGMKRSHFFHVLDKRLEEVPYFFRDSIQKDVDVLKASPLGWKDLREFELAINNKIKGAEGGKQVLGILKDPINMGENLISPSLFEEKQIMNKAYSQNKTLLKSLKQSDFESLLSKGETGGLILGLLTGNPILKGIAIKKGAEFALSRFLVSPRFQGMQRKLVKAVQSNNESSMLNLSIKMLEDLEKFITNSDEKDNQEHNIQLPQEE